MKDIHRVHKHYLDTDGLLSAQESGAATKRERDKWGQVRDTNDQAWFVLLFAQFEDVVNRLCEKLVRRRTKPSVRWASRRPWEIIDREQIPWVAFMNRVALLTEKGGRDFGKVHGYYRTRCNIAHGDFVHGIVVTTVKMELIDIARRMSKSI